MTVSISPFLLFVGSAEEAMNFYVGLFPDSRIDRVQRFGPGEAGKEGTIKRADFTLAGRPMICFDSPPVHAFDFTPSLSLFVECADEAQFEKFFEQLSAKGEVLMPPDNYGFSRRYAWVNDRFKVSWQLNVK
ncbi:MAG: hypothetical protein BIFFINMI_02730 [Phycisphaerae bacterium]|nr:hypothetical protein [Phycisphaerae bacterium]